MSDEPTTNETLDETTTSRMAAANNSAPLSTADLAYGSTQSPASAPATQDSSEHGEPLVSESEAGSLRDRWSDIQGNFVDEPQKAVEEADGLVAEVIQSLAKRFADERTKLDDQWHGGGEASTEDLRQALKHYRSFFQRLLAA